MAAILKTQQQVHYTKVCSCIRCANEVTINRRRCRALCVSIKEKAKLPRKMVLRRPSSGVPTDTKQKQWDIAQTNLAKIEFMLALSLV